HTNWKAATAKAQDQVKKLTGTNADLTSALDVAKKDLDKAKADHAAEVARTEGTIKTLQQKIETDAGEITEVRSKLENALQNAKTALAEAEDRRKEAEQIRGQKSAVEKQANDFKLQQTELNDKIREQERQIK